MFVASFFLQRQSKKYLLGYELSW